MNITDEKIAAAMLKPCQLRHCLAGPGQPCRNLQGRELPTGTVHYYRIEPK